MAKSLLTGEAKCLSAKTRLFVTGGDGTSEMSLMSFCNAVKGGMKLEEVEITLDREHSKRLERKRAAIEEVVHLMRNMNPAQAEKVVEILRGNEDLMNLDEDYS